MLQLLEHEHLLGKTIDDTLSREAFDTYLDRLDGAKLFLLKADRDQLARYRDQIDDELHSGRLDLAHDGQKIYLERVSEVDKIVQALLDAPMNHDDDEYIELDAKKLAAPASDDELKDRWRKRLELEVMERVSSMEHRLEHAGSAAGSAAGSDADHSMADPSMPISDIPTTPDGREAKARADLEKSYAAKFKRLREPGPLDAASELINAVTSTLDPHTDYLPPMEKANFDIQITGSLEGIGATLSERDDYIVVSDLVPGGAAWRQGKLAAGDLILAVQQPDKDPVDISDMRLDDVVQLIRGPKGTIVRLRVRKPDGHEEAIAITRDVINIEESYARGAIIQRKGGGPAYGYIHLPSFYGGSNTPRKASSDIRRILDEMNAQRVAGIILDIRDNGGGLLRDAVDLTGEFIDKGPVVQVRDHGGDVEVMKDEHAGEVTTAPMIVMVDQFSASASEILAGALQDYHRALIVGNTTHGKGTVQAMIDLDRDSPQPVLGVLKLTIQQFFRVSGASTQLEGVTPDVALPNRNSYIKSEERTLDHAIAFSQIAPAPHDELAPAWNLPKLQRDSAARVAKNQVFAKVLATAQILSRWRDDTKVPLQRSAWEAREKRERDELSAVAPDVDKQSPGLVVKLLADPLGAAAAAPSGSGKTDDRVQRWQEAVSRDPWIEESVALLGEMK